MSANNNIIQFRDSTLKAEMAKRLFCSTGDKDPEAVKAEALSISEAARQSLQRYLHLLERSLSEVEFTQAEASLICDALNGCGRLSHPSLLHQELWMNVADFVQFEREAVSELGTEYGVPQKWDCDYDALVEKLKSLTTAQAFAVYDAVQRFWNDSKTYNIESIEEQLLKVGLIREKPPKKISMRYCLQFENEEEALTIFNAIQSAINQAVVENEIECGIQFEKS